MLATSELLADVRVAAILRIGTAGAWVGFANDAAPSAAITGQTRVPASTSALAFRELFRRRGSTAPGW